MIRFYKDNLVPAELCHMLHEIVPKKYHVPVRFHNRRRKDVHGEVGRCPLGSVTPKSNGYPSHIDINLNPIYKAMVWDTGSLPCAPSSALWRLLVEVTLHEFGHVATWRTALKMNQHEYGAEYGRGRVYKTIEHLANEWMDQSIARILRHDPRLGQPRFMTGYFGARLVKWKKQVKDISGNYTYIMERRCNHSGGQLTAGDVLRQLDIDPHSYTYAYVLLRRASQGIGINYTDRAGRRHKLYTWGDVPLLAGRLEVANLRTRSYLTGVKGSDPSDSWLVEDLDDLAWDVA